MTVHAAWTGELVSTGLRMRYPKKVWKRRRRCSLPLTPKKPGLPGPRKREEHRHGREDHRQAIGVKRRVGVAREMGEGKSTGLRASSSGRGSYGAARAGKVGEAGGGGRGRWATPRPTRASAGGGGRRP